MKSWQNLTRPKAERNRRERASHRHTKSATAPASRGQRRSGAVTQRPRAVKAVVRRVGITTACVVRLLPAVLKVVLAIVIGVVIFAGYRAAASASFFQVRTVEVQGTSRVSAQEVQGNSAARSRENWRLEC